MSLNDSEDEDMSGDYRPLSEEFDLRIDGAEDAEVHRTMINTGGAETFRKVTHLILTIDSTYWTEFEDDTWCFFLRAFAPLSENLNHLTIIIRGATLFTRYNYVKPMITYSEEASQDETTPSPKPHQKKKKKTAAKKASPPEIPASNTDTTTPQTQRLNHYIYSPDKIEMHMSEKAIVTSLLLLSTPQKHMTTVTIKGAMELSLRRHIIFSLNPAWRTSEHCLAQAGFSPKDHERVEKARVFEEGLPDMRRILPNELQVQDFHDFGVANVVPRHGLPKDWIVPTGKAGRSVLGWKVAPGKNWKGPS